MQNLNTFLYITSLVAAFEVTYILQKKYFFRLTNLLLTRETFNIIN